MRVKIEICDDKLIHKLLDGYNVWIESPCRFTTGDMILPEIFADDLYKNVVKNWEYLDHPMVESTRFERDKDGIYQVIYLDINVVQEEKYYLEELKK